MTLLQNSTEAWRLELSTARALAISDPANFTTMIADCEIGAAHCFLIVLKNLRILPPDSQASLRSLVRQTRAYQYAVPGLAGAGWMANAFILGRKYLAPTLRDVEAAVMAFSKIEGWAQMFIVNDEVIEARISQEPPSIFPIYT